MLFFRQMDWKEFSNQPHIKKLPINEQMQQFNFHLAQMSNLNKFQVKGRTQSTLSPSATPTVTPTSTPTATPTATPTGTPAPVEGPLFNLPLEVTVAGNYSEQYRIRFNAVIGSNVSDNNVTAGNTINTTISIPEGDHLDVSIARIDDAEGVDTTVDTSGVIGITVSGTNNGIYNTSSHSLPLTIQPGDNFALLNGHSWRLFNLGSDATVTVTINEGNV